MMLCRGDQAAIAQAITDMGVRTGAKTDEDLAEFAIGMFDTTGKVDPFSEDSPIKKAPITDFPKQFFLVLRVVQLFRGLATRMGIEFALADQWAPFAQAALAKHSAEESEGDALPEAKHGRYYGM